MFLTVKFYGRVETYRGALPHMRRDAQVERVISLVKRLPTLMALGLIMFYRAAISPLFPPACRFIPTCSEYGLIAFRRYGFCKGFVLTAKRILKCRPGGPHGYDPVP